MLSGLGVRSMSSMCRESANTSCLRRVLGAVFHLSDADLDSMADFFDCTLAGMRMAAKAGKSRKALRNIAIFAGRAYLGTGR
jgi:hypothetical protein